MAFFTSKSGEHYYGVFYQDEGNGRYSGGFHKISAVTAVRLALIFRVTALVGGTACVAAIVFALLSAMHRLPHAEDFFLTFLAIGALGLIPVAAYVAPRKRVKLDRVALALDRRSSEPVYLSVIAYPAIYQVVTLWSFDTPAPMPYAVFVILFLAAMQIPSVWRLVSIRKSAASAGVDLLPKRDNA